MDVQPLLARDDLLQFDGAMTAYVFGVVYTTLTSAGIEPESDEAFYPTAMEAWGRYLIELAKFTADAQQLAWRWRPEIRQNSSGQFSVYSRLAVFPEAK